MNLPEDLNQQQKRHLPPGPDQPFSPVDDQETCEYLLSLRQKYGDISSFMRSNGQRACFVNEPDAIHSVLVRNQKSYVKGTEFARIKLLLGNGLITSEGDTWRRSRTMIQPSFSKKELHRLIDVIVQCCAARTERWSKISLDGTPLNITREMNTFALDVILRAIFGPNYETDIVTNAENPFAFLSEDSSRDLNLAVRLRSLRQLVLDVIDKRRKMADSGEIDFLSGLLRARDKAGKAFSDRELLDEVMTLVVAGFETSAGTLNWAWYLLARHADVEQRVVSEAAELLPHSEPVSGEHVASLTWLQQCLNETLRLYPPAWIFTRRAIEDVALGDFDLPAGTDIYISPYVLHRTDHYWPEPSAFRPGRFASELQDRDHRSAFIPFSLGTRRCIGEYLAMLEMKIHLGLLSQKFHLTSVDNEDPGHGFGLNLRSRKDIFLRIKQR